LKQHPRHKKPTAGYAGTAKKTSIKSVHEPAAVAPATLDVLVQELSLGLKQYGN
jgi:hypothetical protein